MLIQDLLIDAFDTVLSWDLPDDSCLRAVAYVARQMAGLSSEEVDDADLE